MLQKIALADSEFEEVVGAVRDYWNRRATTFDQGDSFVLRSQVIESAWKGIFAEILGPGRKRILDVGSGTGALACLFHEMGHDPEGVDIAPAMVEAANAKAASRGFAIPFRLGDGHRLPYGDATFDVVHARHLLWTLPRPAAAVAEWMRVLKPGGRLLITESHSDGASRGARRLRAGFGRAVAHSMAWLRRDQRPGPGRPADYPRDRLPFSRGLGRHRLAAFLYDAGLRNVDTRDLLWLRRFQRSHLPWYRRMMSSPLHSYYAGWGTRS